MASYTARFNIQNTFRKRPDLNLSDQSGRTAIFLAIESNNLETVKRLKNAGALIGLKEKWATLRFHLQPNLGT